MIRAIISLTSAASLAVILPAGSAWSYCSEPSAPRYTGPSKPDEPNVPYCVNQLSGTHTCDDWEIRQYNSEVANYNDDVESYQRAVQDFVSDLKRYLSDAADFAQCAVRQLELAK